MRGFALGLLVISVSGCAASARPLSEAQKAAIADSAISVVKATWENFGRLDLSAAFRDYSPAADARYMDNGAVYPSLAAYKKANEQFGTTLEYVHTTADSLSTIVLGSDAVMVTAPWHADMKAKGRPEYKGRGVSSLLVQKRDGRWQIVHTHESLVNPTEMLAALTPASGPPVKK